MRPRHGVIFRLLLLAFPARFRRRFGASMRQEFEAAYAEHAGRGRLRGAAFLVRTAWDMLGSGARERLGSSRTGSEAVPGGDGRGGFVSWLDVKLGLRMFVKHPVTTLVAVFALSIGIPVGLAPWHVIDAFEAPLPVPDGERLHVLQLWSTETASRRATTPFDLTRWREALTSFEVLAAARQGRYNVADEAGRAEPTPGAAVTASAFEVLGTPPLLGRTLQPGDEAPGAEDVVVLGHDLWRSRFGGDPEVLGRSIRVGRTPYTVVGVMPPGFRFPTTHQLWLPLRLGTLDPDDTRTGLAVFGLRREGVSEEEAQSELTTVGARLASEHPERYGRTLPQVVGMHHLVYNGPRGGLRVTLPFLVIQSLALGMLLIACTNVGMLVFARTATRASELAVRTALGASRVRVVAQIFTESVLMAVLAAAVGLGLLDLVSRYPPTPIAGVLPFWMDFGVTLKTAGLALLLASGSAVVAGVVPALRFTGRAINENVRRAGSGGVFGRLTGGLIVLDVAVAVAAVGFSATVADQVRAAASETDASGIDASRYLAASVRLGSESGGGEASPEEELARRRSSQLEIVRLLQTEPAVRSVSVGAHLPRMDHPIRWVEAEGEQERVGGRGHQVRSTRVDPDFFGSLDRRVVLGRGFEPGDLSGDRRTAIVNTRFVENVLGGQNPLGRRFRYVPLGDGAPGPWYEIVGVVPRLGMHTIQPLGDQGIYHPAAPGELTTVSLAIRTVGNPSDLAPRVRHLISEADPTAIVAMLVPLAEVHEGDWFLLRTAVWGGIALIAVLLALATSGIYAILSFSVAQRTREIGVRAALGARRSRIVLTVVRRAMTQVAIGVAIGAFFIMDQLDGVDQGLKVGAILQAAAIGLGALAVIGGIACTAPTLRALRIMPSEALREGE